MRKNNARNTASVGGISDSNLTAFTYTAVCARIYFLIMIDTRSSLNAAWLQLLIGAAYSLPAVFSVYFLLKKHGSDLAEGIGREIGKPAGRLFLLIIGAMFLYEAACVIRIMTSSAEFATLYDAHSPILFIPTVLAVLYAVMKGGNGAGGAAAVFLRIFLVLYPIVILFEAKDMDFKRIFPIFGPGLETLSRNAVNTVIYFMMIPLSLLLRSDEGSAQKKKGIFRKPEGVLALFGLSVVTVALLITISTLSYPVLQGIPDNRSVQMNLLLYNGTAVRALQLPILILWFSGIFLSAVFMLFAAGRLFCMAFQTEHRLISVAAGITAALLALFRLSLKEDALRFSSICSIPLAAFITLLPIIGFLRKGVRRKS